MSMSCIESTLTRLEVRLREIIEGGSASDGIERKFHNQLERELLAVMRCEVERVSNQVALDGTPAIAPDEYTLVLPAMQAKFLHTHPRELDRLTHTLESTAAKSGIVFTAAPMLRVVADPQSAGVKVLAEFSQTGQGDSCTTEMDGRVDGAGQASIGTIPKAFLVVNRLTTFALSEPVTNIGRDPSNQMCLEDMRISRMHAQLRLVQGRFVIFDLDSSGGTFVNGVAVSR